MAASRGRRTGTGPGGSPRARPSRPGPTPPGGEAAASCDTPSDPLLVCDVGSVECPDLETVDALARIHLIGRRAGLHVSVVGASAELCGLLELTGLDFLLDR